MVLLLAIFPLYESNSEQKPSENEILQHYLTIHEIEKELERVTFEEKSLQKEIVEISHLISKQQEQISSHKERAANIARTYYMGDRYDLLILLFSTTDLHEFLQVYDLASYLFEKDQEDLHAFHKQVEQLRALLAQKEQQINDLDILQKHLLAQQIFFQQLDSELSLMMAGLSDQERIKLLHLQLISNWEERGLPAFDLLLRLLSKSMSGVAEEVKDKVTFSLSGAQLTITDQEFTSYIQKQNELFSDFRISFEQDSLTFFGTYDDIVLTLSGSYQLESDELVRFQIEQLKYNGFILPLTTSKALEQEYDLGIYPRQINDRLRIKKVLIEDGELKILFTLQL